MINDILKQTEKKMEQCTELFKNQIKKIHTGRISPNILDNIKVTYYDKNYKEISTPLRYLANITTKNARTLIITVFDNTMINKIEKAIIASDLHLNTNSNNNIIHASSPIVTESYRKNFIKLIYNEAEKTKITIRNIRRSVNEQIKISIKNKEINKDEEYYLQNKVQISTNTWIEIINKIVKNKEIELKTV